MGLSFGHLALLLVIVLLVFGAGKIPQVMKDVAKGVKAFKEGMNENEAAEEDKPEEIKALPPQSNRQKTGTRG